MQRLVRLAALLLSLAAGGLCAQVVTNPAATGIPTSGGGGITGNACTPSNGVTCSVTPSATTPTFVIGLGAISPTSLTIGGVTSTGATGTGTLVFSSSPALTTPNLGTPTAVTLTSATGLPLTTGVTGILPAANGGAGAVTGALKANGSGAVTQAACADLSNGATGCSTATGTSGATIPLLNAANTWSAAQSHNSGTLALKGATSGTTTLNAAATAGSTTITLPGGTTDFSATGGTSQVVKQTSAGGAFTVAQLAASDLSNGTSGSGAVALVTSPTFTTSLITPLVRSTAAKVLVQGTGTGATQLAATQTTVPTCSANCGTSPAIVGTDTAGVVTMGASGTPASGWVVTFNGTWAAAPSCMVQSALATMVVGKMPIAVVTSTTTITVTTNGTAPSASDKYQFLCVGTQ